MDLGFRIADLGFNIFNPTIRNQKSEIELAERVGFEPTEPVKAHSISNAANSTTLAPFQKFIVKENCGLFINPQSKIEI